MLVQTVVGLKKIKKIGAVDSHVHIWANNNLKESEELTAKVSDINLVKDSLKSFKSNSGNLVIDCTPYGCGRDGNILNDISISTDIDVVSVTGFHVKKYYLPGSKIWEFNITEAADFFIDEINKGLKETRRKDIIVKPGVIKIPFMGSIEGQNRTLTDAAIKASIETGVPLLVHTEKGDNVKWFAEYLEKKNVAPQKVVFCHIDKRNDIDLHEELAERGFYLEYDTFLRPQYEPKKNVYKLIDKMIKKALIDSIMIGTDVFDNTMWQKVKKGYGIFFKEISTYLKEKYDEDIASRIMGMNSIKFLNKNE
jgi:5-phospho-D-xylono-1,4-lactonase